MAKRAKEAKKRGIALVTGGSSGIGLELSRLFAKGGYDVIIVARKVEGMEAAAKELKALGAKTTIIQKDLSGENSAEELFEGLKGEKIDVLVNNAGFGTYGFFKDIDMGTENKMMNLNMITLTKLTKFFLRDMVKRKSGKILNIASTAAFQPGPLMAVYYATKAYVLHFTEAIANEAEGTGVTVTALCPGPTETAFQKVAKMQDAKVVQGKIGEAAKVAREGYEGLMRGDAVVIPGMKNKALAYIARVLPRKTVAAFVRGIQERKGK